MTKNLFVVPLGAVVILGLLGGGIPSASQATSAQHPSTAAAAVLSVRKSSPTTPPKTKFTFWGILALGGITCDVQFNTASWSQRVFTMADFHDVHLWDHGTRFTFILLSVHVDRQANPPLPPGSPKTILNHNIPLHNNWVTSVRLHPIGNTLEVTCSLSHPAHHFTLGTTPNFFDFSFAK